MIKCQLFFASKSGIKKILVFRSISTDIYKMLEAGVWRKKNGTTHFSNIFAMHQYSSIGTWLLASSYFCSPSVTVMLPEQKKYVFIFRFLICLFKFLGKKNPKAKMLVTEHIPIKEWLMSYLFNAIA